MTSRERMLAAASFKEADRVPVELIISPRARELPEAQKIVEFIDTHADNFLGAPAVNWGFFGLDSESSQEIIEDVPGEFRRIKRTHRTEGGDFYAITKHNYPHLDAADYHWERRYITSLEELERLADAPRSPRPISADRHRKAVQKMGDRGVPIVGVAHPLGHLVRQATMEEVYIWLFNEEAVAHRFLQNTCDQICATIRNLGEAGITGWFGTVALEMLIPPWLGHKQFDQVVFPYDKAVNDAVHKIGGQMRSHCHGNCMDFLEKMCDMGIDASEPLEPSPFGDVDLAEAKRRVGDRMLLSGNVPSQDFVSMSREEVRGWVRKTIAEAAPGGGFALRTTGGHAGVNPDLDKPQLHKIIDNVEAYMEAGLEFGQYPIQA